jgi:hypothetical protein
LVCCHHIDALYSNIISWFLLTQLILLMLHLVSVFIFLWIVHIIAAYTMVEQLLALQPLGLIFCIEFIKGLYLNRLVKVLLPLGTVWLPKMHLLIIVGWLVILQFICSCNVYSQLVILLLRILSIVNVHLIILLFLLFHKVVWLCRTKWDPWCFVV